MVNKLRAGVVWANTYNKFDPTSPFGGFTVCGEGELIKTFLLPGQVPDGGEAV